MESRQGKWNAFSLCHLKTHTHTHIHFSDLGYENSLPLENEIGVKILEIFVLGEGNSKQNMKRQLCMLPDMLQRTL